MKEEGKTNEAQARVLKGYDLLQVLEVTEDYSQEKRASEGVYTMLRY